MDRFELSNTRWLLTPDLIMLAAGAVLSLLANSMVVPAFESVGYSAAVIVGAAGLLAVAVIPYRKRMWRKSVSGTGPLCLGAGLIFLIIGGVFWVSQSKVRELHTIPLLIALYGCCWSVWNLWLALHLPEYPRIGVALCVLTQVSYAVGIMLTTEIQFTRAGAVAALGVYATLLGLEGLMIPTYFLPIREAADSMGVTASGIACERERLV